MYVYISLEAESWPPLIPEVHLLHYKTEPDQVGSTANRELGTKKGDSAQPCSSEPLVFTQDVTAENVRDTAPWNAVH
jgi:hypothetical protein